MSAADCHGIFLTLHGNLDAKYSLIWSLSVMFTSGNIEMYFHYYQPQTPPKYGFMLPISLCPKRVFRRQNSLINPSGHRPIGVIRHIK